MRRAVIDTNVWVSSFLTPQGPPASVLSALAAGRFQLVISQPLIDELLDVLARPRITRRYNITADTLREAQATLMEYGSVVPLTGDVMLCRDPDDNIVLETALRGGADTLISRDDDIKRDSDLMNYLESTGIQVTTVRQFLAVLAAEEESLS